MHDENSLTYDNFTDCYLGLAKLINDEYEFLCRPRGQLVKEKLAVKFTITNPLARIPYVRARNFSIEYMIAELLWYLSGNDSTEWISKYSSFWKKISDDGLTANSAYGARIFRPHPRVAGGDFIQWEYVKKELSADPDSRRAVIHIRSPHDSENAVLDVPCTLSLQFFIRDAKLHLVANMRSSDLILGIAYDVPAFTLLQELMAYELGVGLGTYTHVSNSLHVYERHFDMLDKMTSQDEISQAKMMHHSLGAMPPLPSPPPVETMMQVEKVLQDLSSYDTMNKLLDEFTHTEHGIHDYWLDWVKILACHRLKKLGMLEEKDDLRKSIWFLGYQ